MFLVWLPHAASAAVAGACWWFMHEHFPICRARSSLVVKFAIVLHHYFSAFIICNFFDRAEYSSSHIIHLIPDFTVLWPGDFADRQQQSPGKAPLTVVFCDFFAFLKIHFAIYIVVQISSIWRATSNHDPFQGVVSIFRESVRLLRSMGGVVAQVRLPQNLEIISISMYNLAMSKNHSIAPCGHITSSSILKSLEWKVDSVWFYRRVAIICVVVKEAYDSDRLRASSSCWIGLLWAFPRKNLDQALDSSMWFQSSTISRYRY